MERWGPVLTTELGLYVTAEERRTERHSAAAANARTAAAALRHLQLGLTDGARLAVATNRSSLAKKCRG